MTAARDDLVRRMAAVLTREGAVSPREDAFRALHRAGYCVVAIARYLDDARQVAQQEQVAEEMTA